MVEIKGTAVNAVKELILTNFKPRYNEWLNSLPADSKEIMQGIILANKWYPLSRALVLPQEQACRIFYNNDKERGSWAYGKFIADYDVKKIYKVFFRLGTPSFTISRAPVIFQTYFRPGEMKIAENIPGRAVLQILNFFEPSDIVEFAIGGWIERTLEMIGCQKPTVKITKSLTKADPLTEFTLKWETKPR